MDRGLVCNEKKPLFVYYKHAPFTSQAINRWTGVMWITVMQADATTAHLSCQISQRFLCGIDNKIFLPFFIIHDIEMP